MSIILFGAPGSGKGTQSKFLIQQFGYNHLSTGDAFREVTKDKESPLAKKIAEIMNEGKLVPDEIVFDVLLQKINRLNEKNRLLFDGFPRTVGQAQLLSEYFTNNSLSLKKVIYLKVSDETVVERISGRLVNPRTGKEYHEKFNPPKVANICDEDGKELIRRADDTAEKVKTRLSAFHNETMPVLEFYKKSGLLAEINGELPIDQITKQISTIIA